LLDSAFNVWSLAADLLAPLFQGGRLRAQVAAARAQLAEALAAYRDLVLESFLEVETALAQDRFYAAEVEAALALLQQAEAAARLARDRYGAGLTDLLALLEAERQRLEAAAQALNARLARVQARVDLYLALGGGFDAR
jgi:outer membrane protein TolC